MFFLYTLFALAAVATLIFAVPLRAKAWAATAVVGLGALAASAGGLVFFPDFGTSPRLGGAPGRGVLHSPVVATVTGSQAREGRRR